MPFSSPSTLSAMIPRTFQIFNFLLLFLLLLLCKSGELGAKLFPFTFFCVTWKRSFREKTSTSNCFPFLRLPAQCFFLCYSSPGPRRAVHYWPWVAQCGKPNANSFVVVVSCCAAYLELRKLSNMNGSKIFFLRINFPFFIFHYRLCYATLSSKRWKESGRQVADVWINRLKRSRQRKQIPP